MVGSKDHLCPKTLWKEEVPLFLCKLAEIGRFAPISARSGSPLPRSFEIKLRHPHNSRPGNDWPGNVRPGNVRPGNVRPGNVRPGTWNCAMVVPFPFPAEKWRKMGPEVPEPHVWAGAGAGVHLGGGPSIRSSPDGQDEAIDTPTTLLPSLQVHMSGDNPAFLYRYFNIIAYMALCTIPEQQVR